MIPAEMEAVRSVLVGIAAPLTPDIDLDRFAEALVTSAALGRINESPRARTTKNPRDEIQKLASLCFDIRQHILSMHGNAVSLIAPRNVPDQPYRPHYMEFAADALALLYAADQAYRDLDPTEEKAQPKRNGQVRKSVARNVAKVARRAYTSLAGTEPTIIVDDGKARGPFRDFLAELFNALGIRASAEAQARAVLYGKTAA